jgi:hypothetical protein
VRDVFRVEMAPRGIELLTNITEELQLPADAQLSQSRNEGIHPGTVFHRS